MKPFTVPSGGDMSFHDGGALRLSGTEGCAVRGSLFKNLGGSGVAISGYNRDAVVDGNEFLFVGEHAVFSMGLTGDRQNNLDGDFPARSVITHNYAHEFGLYVKQTGGRAWRGAEARTVGARGVRRARSARNRPAPTSRIPLRRLLLSGDLCKCDNQRERVLQRAASGYQHQVGGGCSRRERVDRAALSLPPPPSFLFHAATGLPEAMLCVAMSASISCARRAITETSIAGTETRIRYRLSDPSRLPLSSAATLRKQAFTPPPPPPYPGACLGPDQSRDAAHRDGAEPDDL